MPFTQSGANTMAERAAESKQSRIKRVLAIFESPISRETRRVMSERALADKVRDDEDEACAAEDRAQMDKIRTERAMASQIINLGRF